MKHALPAPIASMVAAGEPANFGAPRDEWRAAKEGCAVLHASHRVFAVATGDDRVDFLHGMLTNDIRSLQPGSGIDAAFLTEAGKVVGVLRVYSDDDRLILDTAAWGVDALLSGLARFIIADDVDIDLSTNLTPLVCLEGPGSLGVAADAFGCDLAGEAPCGHRRAQFEDSEIRLSRVSEFGGEGVQVSGPASLRPRARAAAIAVGAVAGGLETLHRRRVECAVPWIGIDMGEDTLLLEIGLPETISRSKGCYLGQEIVERVTARGQVNRTWTRFVIAADAAGDRGAAEPIAGPCDIVTDTGASVGRLTSTAWSFEVDAFVGLGLLHRKGRDAEALFMTDGTSSFPVRPLELAAT